MPAARNVLLRICPVLRLVKLIEFFKRFELANLRIVIRLRRNAVISGDHDRGQDADNHDDDQQFDDGESCLLTICPRVSFSP